MLGEISQTDKDKCCTLSLTKQTNEYNKTETGSQEQVTNQWLPVRRGLEGKARQGTPSIVSLNLLALSLPQLQFSSNFLEATFWPVPGQGQSQNPKALETTQM